MTKMPVSTGIRDHGSRFAALQVDSFSESEDEEPWKRVGSVDKPKPKPRSQGQGQEGGEGGKGGLSKNAKKRAKKKRNQESASSEVGDWGASLFGLLKERSLHSHQTVPCLVSGTSFIMVW